MLDIQLYLQLIYKLQLLSNHQGKSYFTSPKPRQACVALGSMLTLAIARPARGVTSWHFMIWHVLTFACPDVGCKGLALLDSEVGFIQLYQPVVRQTQADASTLQPAPKPTARWLGQMPILAAVGTGAAAVSKGTSQWK